jgi:hypothetical protein
VFLTKLLLLALQVWQHYDFSKVHWAAIPPQLPTWFAMFFVVAFSSSLDVAAIQLEFGKQLDFNKELCMVWRVIFILFLLNIDMECIFPDLRLASPTL